MCLFCFNICCHQAKVEEEAAADPAVVAELQREVEDLKLRLHMAAEHYKEKYKECQRLQKQVLKLSEQQGVGIPPDTRQHARDRTELAFNFCSSVPGSHITLSGPQSVLLFS